MGTGILTTDTMLKAVAEIQGVPGDFAEIGVFRGATFKRLYQFARATGRRVHGFDSFIGLASPGRYDDASRPNRQKGFFSVGGCAAFRQSMKKSGLNESFFSLWPGYVPDCFAPCLIKPFSFIYIDLDHHDPTESAIKWAWPRLSIGGVMAFDDFNPNWPMGASPAICRFLKSNEGSLKIFHSKNDQILIVKKG